MKTSFLLTLVGLASFILLCCTSCNGANDSYKCYESVINAYPDAIAIVRDENSKYIFIVVDSSGSIHYIKTMHLSGPSISSDQLIYKYQ
mgnify:CR=1 FL=1